MLNRTMIGRAISVALCIVMLVSPAFAFAAQERGMSEKVKVKLDNAEGKLKKIEAVLGEIETGKVINEKNSTDMHDSLYRYAEAMKAAFDESIQDTEKAAKSEGKEGNIASIKHFEDMAQAHEKRIKAVEAKTKDIETKVKNAEIQLDEALLTKMTSDERLKFKAFLEPKGRLEMEKKHPRLFKQIATTDTQSIVSIQKKNAEGMGSCNSIAEQLSDMLIPSAEAAAIVGCVGVCTGGAVGVIPAWAACAACVVGAGAGGVAAWNAFTSCWSGAGKPWWVPLWLYRVGCVSAFVIVVG